VVLYDISNAIHYSMQYKTLLLLYLGEVVDINSLSPTGAIAAQQRSAPLRWRH
jgi:hypothetical protein